MKLISTKTMRRMIVAGAALIFSVSTAAIAQYGGTQILDHAALHPPVGAKVAIVEFADLQCPACAHANPILEQAAARYHIPLVRHDFLIPGHTWNADAAVNARWFDAHNKALGESYRDVVFANQTSIYNQGTLHQFTAKFAASHGVALPFAVDPQGKLRALVDADTNLGRRTGIQGTPAIFVVTAGGHGAPYIEVQNVDRDLYRAIDQALSDTRGGKR